MTKRKYVDVTVSWCYGDCAPTAKVSLGDWERVCAGEKVTVKTSYWYEGTRYPASFAFNHPKRGELTVFSEGGGEPFAAEITEASITGGVFTNEARYPGVHDA